MKNIGIRDWLIKMKPYYLTINDVKQFNKNEVIKMLCIDRNFYDRCDYRRNKIPSKPEYFFKNNYQIEYRHDYDINGEANWLGMSKNKIPFTFEINYDRDKWYPLSKQGYINMPGKEFSLESRHKITLSWKECPDKTFLGWRGHMIKWNDIITRNYLIYYND